MDQKKEEEIAFEGNVSDGDGSGGGGVDVLKFYAVL